MLETRTIRHAQGIDHDELRARVERLRVQECREMVRFYTARVRFWQSLGAPVRAGDYAERLRDYWREMRKYQAAAREYERRCQQHEVTL